MNETIATIKKHVHKNRAKYAAAATLTACVAAHILTVKEWDKFLDRHELTEAYYGEEPVA